MRAMILAAEPLAIDQHGEGGRGERLQHHDPQAREERARQRERGVLRRGAHEHEQPLFHMREQRVLLRAVEAVHLVEEHDRAPTVLAETRTSPSYVLQAVDLDHQWRVRWLSAESRGEGKSLYINERRPDTYSSLTADRPAR